MRSTLEQWLLKGVALPEDFNLAEGLAAHPDLADLAADLDAIQDGVETLPALTAPPELDATILAFTAQQQDTPLPTQTGRAPKEPEVANRRWWLGLVAVAAAALLVFSFNNGPGSGQEGDPNNWTERGLDPGLGPEVHLKMAVQDDKGVTQRFTRGTAYPAGHVLFFNVDTHADGDVRLLRIDATGVEVLHQQAVTAGSENLKTPQGSVGYELESGETAAVFAIVRFEQPISGDQLRKSIPTNADAKDVCVAIRSLGGRCSAERVEGVQ